MQSLAHAHAGRSALDSHTTRKMRVTVSTRHGLVSLDDLTVDCSVDDLKRRVLNASDAHRNKDESLADHCLVRPPKA